MSMMPFDDFWRSPRRRYRDDLWDPMMTSRDWSTSRNWMMSRDPLMSRDIMAPYSGREGDMTSLTSHRHGISEMEKKFEELIRKVDERFSGMLSVLDDPEPLGRHRVLVEHEGRAVADAPKARDFSLKIDVQDFKPEEVKVKVQGGQVLVHAKRENKNEGEGMYAYSYREFKKSFTLPQGVNAERLTSSLTSGGILQIDAPVAAAIEAPKSVPVSIEHGI